MGVVKGRTLQCVCGREVVVGVCLCASTKGDMVSARLSLVWCRVLSIQQVAHQALGGLAYLNQQGLVHRALSPENILLTAEVRT